MNKQAVCDVLNNLKVMEKQGGEDMYILVQVTDEVREKLNAVGVDNVTIDSYSEEDVICILTMATCEKYADDYQKGRFIVWNGIDDNLRYRVLNGEGTAIDAERLLKELEPQLYG